MTITKNIVIPQRYTFNKLSTQDGYVLHKPDKMFSKLVWWILKKFKIVKPNFTTATYLTFSPFDQSNLTELMLEQITNAMEYHSNCPPEDFIFVVGHKQLTEIIGEKRIINASYFEIVLGDVSVNGVSYKFYNRPVHVVPNLDGVLLLPKSIFKGELTK